MDREKTLRDLREKRDRESKQALIESACIPTIYRDIELKDLVRVPRGNLKQIAMFIKEFKTLDMKGLYLYSAENGTGKTSLGVLVLKELIRKQLVRRPCFFVDYASLIMQARQVYNQSSDFMDSELVSRVLESEVVMIDEFAMSKTTEFVADFVRFIIHTLWQNKVATILTSNVPVERLAVELSFSNSDRDGQKAANAIVSRIEGMCNVIEIKTGSDYRKDFGRE